MTIPRSSVLAIGLLALATAAEPHAVLLESSVPLASAILRAKVETPLALRFGAGVQPRACTMELVPEHGEVRRLQMMFGPGPGDVTVTIPPLDVGRYTVRYRVVADDGHPTEGTIPVRVAAPD